MMNEAENLGKRYGALEAVRDVSFTVGSGEVVGLLGPNGAGKTTIMRILTCYHLPSSGTARLNGLDVVERPLEVRRSIGYLPENAPLYAELTVREYLQFIAESRGLGRERGRARMDEACEECGIEEVRNRPIGALSKGFRHRVGMAQAILHDPPVLVLDEPTSGLDPNQIADMLGLLKRLGREKTVILSTHILSEVEAVCGRVLILRKGRVVAEGATREIGARARGKPRFRVEIRAQTLAESHLLAVRGVESVESLRSAPGGAWTAELTAAPDFGERIFDWAVERGFKVLSLSPISVSLEEIFHELTLGGEESR